MKSLLSKSLCAGRHCARNRAVRRGQHRLEHLARHGASRSDRRTGSTPSRPAPERRSRKLEEPVTLRFYFSREPASGYASLVAYASRVRDLLQEYAALSGGRIILEEIDPAPFTPAEDEAVAQGLTGAPTQDGETRLFRARRQQHAQRPRSRPLLRSGPRAVSRIRPDLDDLQALDADAAEARDHGRIAARGGLGRTDGGAARQQPAVHDLHAVAQRLRRADDRADGGPHSRPTSRR